MLNYSYSNLKNTNQSSTMILYHTIRIVTQSYSFLRLSQEMGKSRWIEIVDFPKKFVIHCLDKRCILFIYWRELKCEVQHWSLDQKFVWPIYKHLLGKVLKQKLKKLSKYETFLGEIFRFKDSYCQHMTKWG